ncbi:MAG: ribonuclease P protein component [Bacteroidetes Order II. Incertae sedis bacterium]|nr:ribonuclease P protein component [Bacteroidetes Order II. bacterium]
MKPLGLPRDIRLKRKKWIQSLYSRNEQGGLTVAAGSIRILYRLVALETADSRLPFQAGFTMARGIRKAIDRNHIKRHLREAFRLNRKLWPSEMPSEGFMLVMMVLYRGSLSEAAKRIPTDMPVVLKRLQRALKDVIPVKQVDVCNPPKDD